jgi:hypothetical protein
LSSYDPNPDLTTALGDWMTTVPATTDMHYRIGGIAETFMSTLLLMLVEQGRQVACGDVPDKDGEVFILKNQGRSQLV